MRYPGSLPHFVYKCSHGSEYLRRLLERALLFVLFASYLSTIEVACCRNGKPGAVEYELNSTLQSKIASEVPSLALTPKIPNKISFGEPCCSGVMFAKLLDLDA